ncbi:LamG-like jellyroll fold domain-containing protein [Paenibacillus sp. Soil787]|uniref:LamG-like jellyroll fold domain-containing protein n=1 Tax=Paenibacillus sp. Soil787 TaxID=1736411 RepID=UPI0006FE6978|nr:LamG-like jellyroll fold domain-containing protein [Paenibacillus sp. Soil787]KRF41873.1 hypothetical protein ASG93_22195 [Paenibacillus sp. Soil787]
MHHVREASLVPGQTVLPAAQRETLYVYGQQVGSGNINIRPSDLGITTKNYIGRSQFSDPYLDGRVDDFRIYNSALTAQEVTAVMNE